MSFCSHFYPGLPASLGKLHSCVNVGRAGDDGDLLFLGILNNPDPAHALHIQACCGRHSELCLLQYLLTSYLGASASSPHLPCCGRCVYNTGPQGPLLGVWL